MTLSKTAAQIGTIAADIPALVESGSIDSTFLLLAALRSNVDELEGLILRDFHASGVTFAQLGDVLGITRQSAHTRYRKLAS